MTDTKNQPPKPETAGSTAAHCSAFWCERICDNCPYTPQTEASRDEVTASKSKMCVAERIPFMCHKTMKRVAIGEIMGQSIFEDYPQKVCAGWIRETQNDKSDSR